MYSCVIECLGQGEDIVFIHGWGANHSVWKPVSDRVQKSHRCHLVDLPGFGLAQYNVILDLDALLDELAQRLPDQATYCGWSLGGLISIKMALRHPNKVKRLVTLSSSPCFVARNGWPGIEPVLMEEFIRGIHENSRLTLKRFIGLQSLNSGSAKQDRAHLQHVLKAFPFPQQQALTGGLEWLRTIDIRNEIPHIQQAWCAFFSENDAVVPIQTMGALHALNEGIEVHRLSQTGHLALISHTDEIISRLLCMD